MPRHGGCSTAVRGWWRTARSSRTRCSRGSRLRTAWHRTWSTSFSARSFRTRTSRSLRRGTRSCFGSSPPLLESPTRPLHSADELVGEAGRFREPISDGAGRDNPLRGVQVDQVTDTDEDRIDAVLRAQHAADHLTVVDQRCDRAASRSRLTMRPNEPALGATDGRAVEDNADVTGNAEAPPNAQ